MSVSTVLLLTRLALPHLALCAADATDPADWTFLAEDEGVRSYRKELPGERTVAFRGEADLPISPIRILTILSNTDRYTEWNPNVKKLVLLERPSLGERIQYMETFVPFPYQNREVIVHIKTRWDAEAEAIVVSSQSVDHPQAPKDTGCVRARVIFSKYYLRPSADWQSTHMTMEIHADPMGNIPGWIVNLFQRNWAPRTFRAIRLRAQDPSVINNPDIATFVRAEARRLGVKLPPLR